MNIKKILASLLAFCLLVASFSACGNQKPNANKTESTTDAPVDTSPVVVEDANTDFWVKNQAGFDAAIEGTAKDFTFEIVNGEVTILSYTGTYEHLMIPTTINGLPVTTIADGAFTPGEKKPTEETTPEGEEKTEGTPQVVLKTLILPESITTMGKGILAGCKSLHSLQTPLMGASQESKQYLGYLFGATRHEDNARDVPASLKCLKITGEWETMPAYSLFECNDLICLALPEDVTVIEKFALYKCESLKQIDGLASVITFGDRALMDCSSLQSVTISNQAQSIGFGAFEGCDSLVELTLPFVGYTVNEKTYLGYIFGAAQPDFAKGFYPQNLARITVTEACQKLGNYAFFECESLKEIILPEGLTDIGVRAFYGCIRLWSVTIPNTVTNIRELAFAYCDALTSIRFGSGLTTIGINAFYNCDSLVEIALPVSLKSIPASCFAGCTSLTKIELGGVIEVGDQAFRHCNAVTTVTAAGKVHCGEGNDTVKSLLNEK